MREVDITQNLAHCREGALYTVVLYSVAGHRYSTGTVSECQVEDSLEYCTPQFCYS